MKDIVFILVFSVVLLFFAIYPAMKIVDFIEKKKKLTSKEHDIYTIIFTIIISLIGGLFLQYF